MLQQSTRVHLASNKLVSRFYAMTSRNKIILGSALVLAFLFAVAFASAQTQNDQDNLEVQTSTGGGSSVQLESSAGGMLPEANEGRASVETNVDVKSSTSSNDGMVSPQVQLEVNGQEIEVPENGEVAETITNDTGDGSVQVNVHSSLTENDDDRTRIRIDSETESEVRIRN